MAYYDKDKIKNALTEEQIFEFAEYIGGEPIRVDNTIVLRTICHNGSNQGSSKLYYYDNTKLFNCYTGCGSMDIFELYTRVIAINENIEKTFYEAMDFVARFFNLSGIEGDTRFLGTKTEEDADILRKYAMLLDRENEEKITVEYKIYNNSPVDNLSFVPPQPWIDEGISIDTMKKYQIKYYATEHKIVIPHYNLKGDLIGIRGRAMNDMDAELYGKYMPLSLSGKMYSHPLSHNLFGLNFNLKNIQSAKKVIIFEGEKSVMLYDSYFGEENNISVATCGSSLSIVQEAIIKKFCNVDEVVFAYDKEFKEIGDDEFYANTEYLIRLANRLKNYYTVSFLFDKDKDNQLLEYKDAPIDQGAEVFQQLFNNRVFL